MRGRVVVFGLLFLSVVFAQHVPRGGTPKSNDDPCAECHADADCVELMDGFKCKCKKGFEGIFPFSFFFD